MRLRTHGQALTIVALFLPVLIACWLLAIELVWRSVTVHSVSDALRAANRSAVQTFDYAAFAQDRLALAEPYAVVAVARRLAATNLTGIKGLARSPDEIAAAADWQVLPAGGQCTLEASRPPLRFLTPALCSRADIDLISPLGFSWRMRVYAADTLDRSSAIAGS